MDSSFREQGSDTQKASPGFFLGGTKERILARLINWLANLTRLTEEEQEAGIYLDHPRGE